MADNDPFRGGLNDEQRGQYDTLSPLGKRLLTGILYEIPMLGWNRALTFAQYFPSLALMDSIHDFWPERTRVDAGQDANEDEDEVIDERRMEIARSRLVGVIKRYWGAPQADIASLLTAITGGAVRSATSNFEPNVEKYLKTQIRELDPQVSRISFDEILTKAPWTRTDEANWPFYRAAIKSLGDGVEIYPGGRRLKTMSEGERNKIGFFVLAYLNPEQQPGKVEAGQPEFTFDAAAKDVDKILGGLEQTYNAIFPQNIADSASTSFSALKGRAKYHPAHAATSDATEQIYRSNVYSANKFQLSIVDGALPFGPKNRFGFGLKAMRLLDGATATAPFGVRASQGPSVNYLIDLLTNQGRAAPPGKVLNLENFFGLMGAAGFDEDLLYDLKRTGDAEQVFRALIALLVEGTNISLVTIDRLCSVLARLLGLPTIFHTIKGFYVYRGEGGAALTPEENVLRAAKFRAKELVEKLMIIETYRPAAAGAKTELIKMHEYIGAILPIITVFSDPVAVPDVGRPNSEWAERSNEHAGTFAASLLRYRLLNIQSQIEKIIPELAAAQDANTPIYIDALKAIEALTPANVTADLVIKDVYNNYSNFLNESEEIVNRAISLSDMGLAFDITTTPAGVPELVREPLYVELIVPGTTRLKRGVKSTFYNFSAAPFGELQIAVGKLLRENRGRVNEKTIESSLRDYFRARDVIKEDFFDIPVQKPDGSPVPMKDIFEEITDITSGLTPSQSIGATAAAGGSQTLLAAIRRSLDVSPVPAVAVGGGRPVQVGGATSPYQWYDLDDLLFELSDKAYGFYHSALVELWAGGISDHRALTGYLDVFRPLVDEIQSQWLQTIADLRLRAVEEYPLVLFAPAVFEETTTTDLISFILSFRSDEQQNVAYLPMYGTPTGDGNTVVPKYMFGDEYSRRDNTVYQDIARELLTGAIPELKILYFLTRIRMRYNAEGRVNARNQWLKLGSESFLKFLMGFGSFPEPMARKAPKSGRTYYEAKAKADAEKALAKLNKMTPLSPYESDLARNAIFAKQSRGQELTSREKEFMGRPKVGGLRERRSLYSNASEPHALPVRPPSDERLRERRRTRRAPRVRQSTRNSRRRGQRDDLDRV